MPVEHHKVAQQPLYCVRVKGEIWCVLLIKYYKLVRNATHDSERYVFELLKQWRHLIFNCLGEWTCLVCAAVQKQWNSFVTIFESFVSSLTSHLATAQHGCVLHHTQTVVGEGRRAVTALWKPTDGVHSQHPLNAAVIIWGNRAVIWWKASCAQAQSCKVTPTEPDCPTSVLYLHWVHMCCLSVHLSAFVVPQYDATPTMRWGCTRGWQR